MIHRFPLWGEECCGARDYPSIIARFGRRANHIRVSDRLAHMSVGEKSLWRPGAHSQRLRVDRQELPVMAVTAASSFLPDTLTGRMNPCLDTKHHLELFGVPRFSLKRCAS